MTYLIKQNKPSFFSKKILAAIVFVVLALIIILVRPVQDIGSFVLSPFFAIGDSFSGTVRNAPENLKSRTELLTELQNLEEELERLRIDRESLEALTFENKSLRMSLSLRPAATAQAAEVIARPPQIPFDTLMIDRGKDDGLESGNLVLAGDRVLLGKLGKVSQNFSIVILNSFGQTSLSGSLTRTGEALEMRGTYGGMEAEVPIDFDIEIGDIVITEHASSYTTAIVGSVEENKSSGRKLALLSLPVPISKVKIVFIIK